MSNELMQYDKAGMALSDPAAVAAAEAVKARIQSAYIMAMRNPRNGDEARQLILKECRRPSFAEKVEFAKPVGGRKIKGASIRSAEVALRYWKNVFTDVQVLHEDATIRRTKVMVTDLETNTSFSKEIQISKTVERKKPSDDREILGTRTNTQGEKVFIVSATEDEIMNKEGAAISKAIRNEGLRLIPGDIIEEAIEIARETLRHADAKDPDAAKKKLLDAFFSIGVKPSDIQTYLKHDIGSLTPAELETLRGMYAAIRDGEATWREFAGAGQEDKAEMPVSNPPDPPIQKQQQTPPVNRELIDLAAKFDAQVPKGTNLEYLNRYLAVCAKEIDIEPMYVKAAVAKQGGMASFIDQFAGWVKTTFPPAQPQQQRKPSVKDGDESMPDTADALKEMVGNWRRDHWILWEKKNREIILKLAADDPRRAIVDWKWKNTFNKGYADQGQPAYVAPPTPPPSSPDPVQEEAPKSQTAGFMDVVKKPLQPEEEEQPPHPAEEGNQTPFPPVEKPAEKSPEAPPAVTQQQTNGNGMEDYLVCSARRGKRVHQKVCQACVMRPNCGDYKAFQGTAKA